MQLTNELSLNDVDTQFEKVFKCPTALAQGVSAFNIPDDTIAQIKAEQKEYRLNQTILNHTN